MLNLHYIVAAVIAAKKEASSNSLTSCSSRKRVTHSSQACSNQLLAIHGQHSELFKNHHAHQVVVAQIRSYFYHESIANSIPKPIFVQLLGVLRSILSAIDSPEKFGV